MKFVDIVIGEQYEEKYNDFPVTALDIRENPGHGRREVWVRKHDGTERFTTAVRIERLWSEVESERATVEHAGGLLARLRAIGLTGHVRDGRYGYGKPGTIHLNHLDPDEAEAILAGLGK